MSNSHDHGKEAPGVTLTRRVNVPGESPRRAREHACTGVRVALGVGHRFLRVYDRWLVPGATLRRKGGAPGSLPVARQHGTLAKTQAWHPTLDIALGRR